jgi:TPR repeat protein
MFLLVGKEIQHDLTNANQYFKVPAENGSPEGQIVVGRMIENGIVPFMDLREAVRYCDLLSNQSLDGAALYSRCYQTGRGIPVDLTFTAQYLQKAADSNNPIDSNSFGCCPKRGEDIDKRINQAVQYS